MSDSPREEPTSNDASRPTRQLTPGGIGPDDPTRVPRPSPEPGPAGTAGLPGTPGRYVPLHFHAKGGLGEVHVALDAELGRQVALKSIQVRYADDPDSRRRFLLEAEITGRLEHPGIVPVYGLVQDAQGQPCYAMRFIAGESLQEAIRGFHAGGRTAGDDSARRLALRQLLARFVAVCNTLAYAHSRGIVHRDLKPANILLGPYGETLVVDWGLAKPLAAPEAPGKGQGSAVPAPLTSDSPTLSLHGQVLGTPGYMSPEQAAGRWDAVGPVSDIYGLGATLYALLTGRTPVRGRDTQEVLAKVQRGDWLPPCAVSPETPPALDAVCRKAMALRPEDRYATALDLAADVEHWLADEPTRAWPEPWSVRLRRWLGRHQALVAGATAAVLVATACLAVATVLLRQAGVRERRAKEEALRHEADARAQRDAAGLNEYVSRIGLAQRAWDENQAGRMFELLEAGQPGEGESDPRGFEWYYLWHLSPCTVLAQHTRPVTSVAFHPGGAWLASGSRDGTVRFWDVADARELRAVPAHEGGVGSVAISPDGVWLASAGSDGTVKLWEAATGKAVRTLPRAAGPFTSVAFSPDSRLVAAANEDKLVRVWEAATGRAIAALKGHLYWPQSLAFAPDGRHLASTGFDDVVRIWDVAARRQVATFRGHTGRVRGLAYSPDGRYLATAARDETVRIWDVATGEACRVLHSHMAPVYAVAYSPDGRRLASGGYDGIRVWEATTGQELLWLRGHRRWVTSVAFAPNGRRLASGSWDGSVRIWRAGPYRSEPEARGEALARVKELFDLPLPRDEVVNRLRTDRSLSEAVREQAIRLAEHYPERPVRLNDVAWEVVRRPDQSAADYRRALHRIEVACRLQTPDEYSLNTLGVARYRVGQYREALEALLQADKQGIATNGASAPEDLAFLAMTYHRLGQPEQARIYAQRLREVMRQPLAATNEDAQGFWREVQELLGKDATGRRRGKASPP